MRQLKAFILYFIVFAVAAYLARRWPRGPRGRLAWLAVGVAAAVGAVVVLKATDTPWYGDYESAYYPGGQMIISAPDDLYKRDICVFGYVNLPLLALPLAPISALEYGVAVRLFTLIGVVLIAAAARATWRTPGLGRVEAAGVIIALYVVNGPLWYSVREGNLTHFLLLPLIIALGLLGTRRGWLAGALLGLAAVIKLPLLLFFAYLVGRLRIRAAGGFLLAVGLIVGGSVIAYGPELHQEWLEQCIFKFSGKPLAAFNVQSLPGFLARLYGGNTYEWLPKPIGGSFPLVQRALSLALAAGVAVVLLKAGRPQTRREYAIEFSIVLMLILLVSPLSWTHYFLFALMPLAMLMSGELATGPQRIRAILAVVAVVLLSLPLQGFDQDWPAFRFVYDRFFASPHFFGSIALLILLIVARLESRASQGHDRP